MSDSDIASSIFGDYGLTPVVDTSQPTRQEDDVVPIQRGTDMQFLRRLAERNGYDLFVASATERRRGPLPRPQAGRPAPRRPDRRLRRRKQRRVADDHPRGAATDDGEGRAARRRVSGGPVRRGRVRLAGRPRREVRARRRPPAGDARRPDRPGRQLPTSRPTRKAVVDRSSWAIRADGELATDHYEGILRASKPVSVRGVGKTLSGTYYVERVLHAFTPDGYSQQFTLRRNALTLSGSEDFTESEALAS